MRATRAIIDLAALRHNLAQARAAAPATRIMAAIKANGYGHGLERIGHALSDADALGVACLAEAQRLREVGVTTPIVLLEGFFDADELPLIAQLGLETNLHHEPQLLALEQTEVAQPITVWVKVDTGMHRLGFAPEEVGLVVERLRRCRGDVRLRGFMTHLACADDLDDPLTPLQLERFAAATAGLPGERAIANSAGLLGWPAARVEWARPGIMLYGVSPFLGGRGEAEGLRPVMTLTSRLIARHTVARGEAIGYGATYRCAGPTLVGVVAVGYGDGYPRHAPSGTPVLVNGQRVPLIGRVSMDMITVDLSAQPEAMVGDPVILWGRGLPVEEVAEMAGTMAYELLCGVAPRVAVEETG